MTRRWNAYSQYLQRRYGQRVYRVGVDAHLSCPNRDAQGHGGCSFCDGTGAVAVHLRTGERDTDSSSSILLHDRRTIEEQIEAGLRFIRYRYHSTLAMLYFQAWSNTNAPVEVLKDLYDRGLSCHDFVSLIVSTRPDLVADDVVSLLSSYITPQRDVWVELGLQSASDETLKRIGRGHDVACYVDAVSRLRDAGIRVCTHVMLVTAYEGRQEALETIRLVNRVHSDAVKIHDLCLTRGTRLLDDYRDLGCLPCASLRRHVEDVSFLLAHLEGDVIVERLLTEMTNQRLVYPRHFPDKRDVLAMIDAHMEARGWVQGCLAAST